jgi:hypothetical protein
MNKLSKKQITQKIYNSLPSDSPYKNQSLDKLNSSWWWTKRSTEGLRLTEEGMNVFKSLELEYFDFDFPLSIDKHVHVGVILGKKISCPYYIGFKSRYYKSAYIRIYDSRIAMLIALYGTLQEYLEATKI